MRWLLLIFALLFLAPVAVALVRAGGGEHWSRARSDSAGLAPDPATTEEAVIQTYCAASWGLKGAVADHCWIAVKTKGAPVYTRYDVVGWAARRGGEAIRVVQRPDPDGRWAGNEPHLVLDRRGEGVEPLIEDIENAIRRYPYPRSYRIWPGPNSNSFVAWVGREVPALGLELPPRAFGKDYLGGRRIWARAPSGTGVQLSLFGLLSVIIAREEGFEISIGGFVVGFDPFDIAVKVPGLGRFGWR
ncbi:MAG: DUF3750 domain-containing protein [Geminicoccaceae bacterium]